MYILTTMNSNRMRMFIHHTFTPKDSIILLSCIYLLEGVAAGALHLQEVGLLIDLLHDSAGGRLTDGYTHRATQLIHPFQLTLRRE